jgi:GNAT superfamily N-acetyltransferase
MSECESAVAPVVRRGGPVDAPALAEFAARTFAEAFGPANRPEDLEAHLVSAYGVTQQGRELADPQCITVLIQAGDSLVAYAQVRRRPPPACVVGEEPVELHRFYVDRPWHGQGVAQRLMDSVYAAARDLGGRTLWLGVWERNPRAIAFYLKSGWRDTGATTFCVGPDRQTDRVMVTPVPARGVS